MTDSPITICTLQPPKRDSSPKHSLCGRITYCENPVILIGGVGIATYRFTPGMGGGGVRGRIGQMGMGGEDRGGGWP